ncbi:leukotriene B4 receptor 1-like [Spea bombifrons]|uniref:leukotriene B4 receptor 1-like n=1 Tax=Spea bombifrons TaxID=233779 RepID=UPI00234A07AF|nr:leukotriene B4 receptor 1-like [Spea bombifrons]
MTDRNAISIQITIGNSTPANFTQQAMFPPASSPQVGIALLSIAFLLGFPGNAFIIWTVLTHLKKRTVTCILILHLAVADIIVILTGPFFIHLLATGSWAFGSIVCKLCHYIGCLSMYVSIFLITFMSLDRFLAVAIPFSSQKIRTKTAVRTLVLVIWSIASVLAIPMLVYRTLQIKNNRLQCLPSHSGSGHIIFQYLFESLLGFFIPFTIIVSCYLYICLRLRSLKFQSKQKTSRLVICIVVTFALFWIPYHTVNILQVIGETVSDSSTRKMLKKAAQFARPNVTALIFLSSSVNPVLYTFAGGSFIKTAGLGFMAKLFEGTSSEAPSFRKVTQVFRQKSRNESVELGCLRDGEVEGECRKLPINPTQ